MTEPACRCGAREGDRGGKFYKRHWREGSEACELSRRAINALIVKRGWRERLGPGECCGAQVSEPPTPRYRNRHKSLDTPPCWAAALLARRHSRTLKNLPPEDPAREERAVAAYRREVGGEPETERERSILREMLRAQEGLTRSLREGEAARAARRMETEARRTAAEGAGEYRLTRGWREYAACRAAPISLEFFPEDPDFLPPDAALLCSACAVRGQCLLYALRDPDFIGGIWGGVPASVLAELREGTSPAAV